MGGIVASLEDLGTTTLVAIGILVVVQLTLVVLALVSLVRRPASAVRGPKWLWVLIIVFGELVGPIVYFAVARAPEQVDVGRTEASTTPKQAESVADVLYGPRTEEDDS